MFFAILVFSNRFSKCTGLRRGYLITKTWLVPFISFPFASLPMADASSIVYRTQPAPVARDWYYHLRRAIPTVRILSRPETPDDDTRSTFRTCAKGRLLRCLTFIHAALVSLLRLSFSHSLLTRILFSCTESTRRSGSRLPVRPARGPLPSCCYPHGPLRGPQDSPWSLGSLVRSRGHLRRR